MRFIVDRQPIPVPRRRCEQWFCHCLWAWSQPWRLYWACWVHYRHQGCWSRWVVLVPVVASHFYIRILPLPITEMMLNKLYIAIINRLVDLTVGLAENVYQTLCSFPWPRLPEGRKIPNYTTEIPHFMQSSAPVISRIWAVWALYSDIWCCYLNKCNGWTFRLICFRHSFMPDYRARYTCCLAFDVTGMLQCRWQGNLISSQNCFLAATI